MVDYVRNFLNDKEMVSQWLLHIHLGKQFKFYLWFERHKQEINQVKLGLQNKQS